MYLLVVLLIRFTNSPIKSMDGFWVNTAFSIPLVLVPLSFGLYWIPASVHKWFLLRMWIVGIIGSHYVLSRSLDAHSEGGPGIGTAYMMGMIIVFFVLIACSVFVLIKFR
jgi:hypothetical protein